MVIAEKHTSVLIVGAGPTGLMMAAQLLRYGIQPLIIDSKDGPTTHSKALAVQARSLEIYRQMGIVNGVLANGKQAQGLVFNQQGSHPLSLELNNIGQGQTPYPYILLYPQSKNERSLLDYLTLNCCPVYWNTNLVALRQKGNSAEATITNAEGEYTIACDWVIGADGAHSVVRKQLQLPFKGDTYPHYFYLIDAQLKAPALVDGHINLYLGDKGFAGFFPMPDKDTYRVLGNLPEEFAGREDITAEDILPYLQPIIKTPLSLVKTNWFTTYKLHHRMAGNFRQGNCFLVGDAAHIHSPVGGQGMNTGLQDAYNLAWKLAGVVNGKFNPSILNSYADERMPVAKTLLKTTDAAFNIIMSQKWLARLFKKHVLFNILGTMWKSDRLKSVFFKQVSQTGIGYRDSKINLHLSHLTHIKAGDRLPYLKIHDEKHNVETDLHEWCSKPGFTLIILGRFDEMFLFNIAKWITRKYPGILNFYYLPPSGKNLDVFGAFQANPHLQKAIIVRPDMYIGYLNDVVNIEMFDNYLQNVVGVL